MLLAQQRFAGQVAPCVRWLAASDVAQQVDRKKTRQIFALSRRMFPMKSIAKLCSVCVLVLAGVAQAQELIPIPDMQIPAVPSGHAGVETVETVVYVDPVFHMGTLFSHVKYTDLHEMSPCATPKLIMVKNPCADDSCCNCCEPKMVCIEICVPPCACEEVTCRRAGNRIRYTYGKYAVDVRIKHGYIQVDYQD